jgi:hypothetical protein
MYVRTRTSRPLYTYLDALGVRVLAGSTLGVYCFGLIFVSARTNKRHHHHKQLIIDAHRQQRVSLQQCRPPAETRTVSCALGTGIVFAVSHDLVCVYYYYST